ncbi:MAG: hypothetical protein AB8F74_13370, partial [Saprospiraceae bacterium]
MGEDRLEKFIKDQVFDHQTPTDTDKLWAGIMAKQEVEEKPKRRFFYWFWLSGGVLLLSGLLSYGLISSYYGDETLAETEQVEKEKPTSTELATSKNDIVNNNTLTDEVISAKAASENNTALANATSAKNVGEVLNNNSNSATDTNQTESTSTEDAAPAPTANYNLPISTS